MTKRGRYEMAPMIGRKFSQLTVICRAPNRGSYIYWVCQCTCGLTCEAFGKSLRKGVKKTCGCYRRPAKHGMRDTREYKSWMSMKHRCDNPDDKCFQHYGGRGIGYCEAWNEFEAFYRDMGPRPTGTSLDRKDNDLGYSKENCRWATSREQSINKSNTRILNWEGKEWVMSDLAVEFSLAPGTLCRRLKLGWDLERALTTKPLHRGGSARPA